MLPSEVLENLLLFLTRRELDKLTCVSSNFADIILTDAFAAQSPLRSMGRIILNSLQEVIITVAKEGGGQRELRFPLSDDTARWTRLSFFTEIMLTARVPELLQWVRANQAVLHGENLTVPTPLANLELFNVHSFQQVAFVTDRWEDWRSHVGARQRIPMQCALLRDCESLNVNYGLSGYVDAMPDFLFEIQEIVQWLQRPTASTKNKRLVVDLKQIDGDVVRLVEMLEEHAINATLPVSYYFMVGPLGRAMLERLRQIRSRHFNRTTREYFEVRCMEESLIVCRRKLF